MEDHLKEGNMIWVVLGVITIILGLLLSFILPSLIHMVMFTAGDLIYIKTPTASKILFPIGTVFLALFFFLMYYQSKKMRIAAGVSVILFVVISSLSLSSYSVIREERIVHSDFFTLSSTEYSWNDISNAVLLKGNEETPYETLVLTMADGTELFYDRDPKLRTEFNKVDFILESHGIYFSLKDRQS
ncbi:hypothetical protein [Jeotgalibacillus proteolyticus]|uniref:Uncharacterized protein n=1 Tax=Jeotgalibacillus proteolyticus TaxID=2082395 RepID=A0A2S5GCB2_9BACL|nr:hypothetical protein [Jeotgalibacillus proteolyticus]PPA70554.1 hypothetical protein C4B60_07045 [Jeotgalibacillus proteolyticus]